MWRSLAPGPSQGSHTLSGEQVSHHRSRHLIAQELGAAETDSLGEEPWMRKKVLLTGRLGCHGHTGVASVILLRDHLSPELAGLEGHHSPWSRSVWASSPSRVLGDSVVRLGTYLCVLSSSLCGSEWGGRDRALGRGGAGPMVVHPQHHLGPSGVSRVTCSAHSSPPLQFCEQGLTSSLSLGEERRVQREGTGDQGRGPASPVVCRAQAL